MKLACRRAAIAMPARSASRPGDRTSLAARALRPAALLALGLSLISRPGHAQARPDSVRPDSTIVSVDPLVVRVRRPTATRGGASALEVRPDSLAVAPAPTLEQVLRALPLVQVRANSRGEAQLSLRGSEARQVAVLVDGVPLSLGWDHRADLAVVPMTAARSVTLIRGLPSVLHGPNVLGGVVEVSIAGGAGGAASPQRPEPLQASLGVDHLGGRSLGAVVARPFEPGDGSLVVRAGLGYRERPDVALPGAVEPGGAAGEGRRLNSDMEQVDGFVALRYRHAAGGWLSLSASGYRAERGVPPELHVAAPRFWRYPEAQRLVAAVSGGTGHHRTPWGEGDLEASLGVDLGATDLHSYADAAFDRVTGTEQADDRTLTLRLLGDHTLGGRGELRGAFTLAEVAHRERIDDDAPADYRQRLWSLGGEVAWRLGGAAGAPLAGPRLTLGLAFDGADTPESGDKPPLGRLGAWGARLGASAAAAEGRVLLHAGLSRRARFPALRELYSGALGRFAPNPGLRPEVLVAGEAGATARLDGVELQAVAFHQRLSDVIVRAATGDGRFRRENRDEMRSTGLELLSGWRLGPTAFTADLTLQRVRVLDPTAPGGERRAEYQPAVAGRLDWSVPLALGARGTATVGYLGRQWCVHPDLGREVGVAPSSRLDLQVGRLWRRIEGILSFDNVLDSAVYDQCGLPQPGRTLRLQARLR